MSKNNTRDSKKYSEVILTDDNFDDEIEKLADILGISHTQYDTTATKLDNSFTKQLSDAGFEEWISQKTVPHRNLAGNDYPYTYGKVAYEFGNMFVIFDFEHEIDFG